MMITLYGIKSCDTVRQARRYFAQHQIDAIFIDYRENPLSSEKLAAWLDFFGITLINKRSTTYRQLPESLQLILTDDNKEAIVALLQQYPTLIKRPVIECDGRPKLLGWNSEIKNFLLTTK